MALGRGRRVRPLRILFVTDLHASEMVFRKMLNAVEVYEAECLIVGGDLAGKALVPIVGDSAGFTASVNGETVAADQSGLAALRKRIRDLGQYPEVMSEDEYQALAADPDEVHRLFLAASRTQVAEWAERVAARMEPRGIPVYITGGNDDFLVIDEVLEDAPYVINANGRVLEIARGIEMIASGYSNPTPWNCPRDIPDEELYARIVEMADQLRRPESAIFNLHAPPYGIGIDVAPRLDTSVTPPRPIVGESIPVGSRSVGTVLAEYQPILGLHGHVHESRGVKKLGRTTCVNPGSEYTEGLLCSAVIDLGAPGELRSVQLLVA